MSGLAAISFATCTAVSSIGREQSATAQTSLPSVPPRHVATAKAPAWQSAITEGTMNVYDGSRTQSITYIRINTRNPHVHVESVVANHHFGSTATLIQLAKSAHAIAAINGTFFKDYSDNMPQSTIMIDGQYQNLWGPTILGIGSDGTLKMFRGQEALYLTWNGDQSKEVHAWGLNTWHKQAGAIDVFTSYFGKQTNIQNGTSVVVQNGIVQSINHGNTSIPTQGYVVELMDDSDYNQRILSWLHVGSSAQIRVDLTDLAGTNTIEFPNIQGAIGSGPMLVDGGRIVLNPTLEKLTDPSLLNPVTRRSLVGIDANGNLVMATVRFANMAQLSEIANHMHLKSAMNLDGGSSSGLYFNGQSLLTPGRKLADALTVTYQ